MVEALQSLAGVFQPASHQQPDFRQEMVVVSSFLDFPILPEWSREPLLLDGDTPIVLQGRDMPHRWAVQQCFGPGRNIPVSKSRCSRWVCFSSKDVLTR